MADSIRTTMADAVASPDPSSGCAICSKQKTLEGKPLFKCAACHAADYCSKNCQKADWKHHKVACKARNAGTAGSTGGPASKSVASTTAILISGFKTEDWNSPLGRSVMTWHNSRPETEVYDLLIDTYRLRIGEVVALTHNHDDAHLGCNNPTTGFRVFLMMAEKTSGLLPKWWSDETLEECIAYALDPKSRSKMWYAVKVPEIVKRYGDNAMPKRSRMLAELILRTDVETDVETDVMKSVEKSGNTRVHNPVHNSSGPNDSASSETSKTSRGSSLGVGIAVWHHDHPEEDVFKLLIDSYHLVVTLEHKFPSIQDRLKRGDSGDPMIGLRRYLEEPEKKGTVLPSWWTDEKREACIAKGDEMVEGVVCTPLQ